MKKAVFQYFDEFYLSDLIVDNIDWLKPKNTNELAYSPGDKVVFYSEGLQESVRSIYGLSQTEFRSLIKEWFEDRYKFKVLLVL